MVVCSAIIRILSDHPMISAFLSTSDYIIHFWGQNKLFWGFPECRMHLKRTSSTNQLHDYYQPLYCHCCNSLSHPHNLNRGCAYTQLQFIFCNCTLSFIHALIRHVSCPPCIHACHAQDTMPCTHLQMAGMAYTVGYIVHGPSKLASAV